MPGVDLNYFIRQANKLTEKIEERRQKLAEETVEAQAGDGRVTVVATGARTVQSIKIDPKLIDPSDPSMLEDLVTAAVNAALAKAKDHEQRELGKVSGGVKIPGITG
jgi:DNA-binding YbaB/EbfC family protein